MKRLNLKDGWTPTDVPVVDKKTQLNFTNRLLTLEEKMVLLKKSPFLFASFSKMEVCVPH